MSRLSLSAYHYSISATAYARQGATQPASAQRGRRSMPKLGQRLERSEGLMAFVSILAGATGKSTMLKRRTNCENFECNV